MPEAFKIGSIKELKRALGDANTYIFIFDTDDFAYKNLSDTDLVKSLGRCELFVSIGTKSKQAEEELDDTILILDIEGVELDVPTIAVSSLDEARDLASSWKSGSPNRILVLTKSYSVFKSFRL